MRRLRLLTDLKWRDRGVRSAAFIRPGGVSGIGRWRPALLGVVLAALVVVASPAISAAAVTPPDYAGVRATLAREISRAMKASGTVGLSIALVDGDRTVWARGFGRANEATKTPVTKDTLFHIGSASKTMTATAVMQLVEQGRVDLDAPCRGTCRNSSSCRASPGT